MNDKQPTRHTQGGKSRPAGAFPKLGRFSPLQIGKALLLILLVVLCAQAISARYRSNPGLLRKNSDDVSAAQPAAETQVPIATPEPTPEYFTISAIGDLTLASHQNLGDASEYSYTSRMNGDYTYPFQNTIQYFEADDLTIGNLECTFSDRRLSSSSLFYFQAPADRANVLPVNSIDFVTTANNHCMDFGEVGFNENCKALEAVGQAYGIDEQAQIITTESGLRVGIYTVGNDAGSSGYIPSTEHAVSAIEQLREDGAEYIICMFHWGKELQYTPSENMISLAHACIDAGAGLVYGTHPHCLEPVEEYNGGIILYSMGNFSFGGNTDPTDWDTAIVQVQVVRKGTETYNEGWTAIPCRCSENTKVNDYKPTPYEEDSEDYARIMSKLLGTYEGENAVKDYSGWYASYS